MGNLRPKSYESDDVPSEAELDIESKVGGPSFSLLMVFLLPFFLDTSRVVEQIGIPFTGAVLLVGQTRGEIDTTTYFYSPEKWSRDDEFFSICRL